MLEVDITFKDINGTEEHKDKQMTIIINTATLDEIPIQSLGTSLQFPAVMSESIQCIIFVDNVKFVNL